MGFWNWVFAADEPLSSVERAHNEGQQDGSEGWHGGYWGGVSPGGGSRSLEEAEAYKAGQEHALGQRDYQRAKDGEWVSTHWNEHWEAGFNSAREGDKD